jgi:5-methylcytosine-specific restriction protein A
MPQRIPSHKPPRLAGRPRRDDSKRPNAAARGYCDKAHRAWRQAVLTRDAWQCQACGRVCGDRREAHADHIVPVSQGGERYAVSNGQCLCVSCHGRKTRGEQVAAATAGNPGATRGADRDTNLRTSDPSGSSFVAARDTP